MVLNEQRELIVPISRTSLSPDEVASVLEPLNSGWLVQGKHVDEFEAKWSDFTGAAHSIATTSCTSALHLSLLALGIGPGDEVIVPAFTWVSTANVVEHVGATVVFVDISLTTFNLDVDQLESRITGKTRAIMPVHLFGLSADMVPIMDIAGRYGLHVVEDAACGFGSTYFGTHVGNFGDTGSFSFHPRKAITTGEGGMITPDDDHLDSLLRRLRDHGAASTDFQRHQGPKPYLLADFPNAGLNQRMTDIQAALGSAQMDRSTEITAQRRGIARRFDGAFKDIASLRTPIQPEGFGHGFQSYACLFKPEEAEKAAATQDSQTIRSLNRERNKWMEVLQKKGISTRPSTHAVHMLEYYQNKYQIRPEDFPSAFVANDCSISLPLFHGMTEEEQQKVISVISETAP
jgi:perosamine synthetase